MSDNHSPVLQEHLGDVCSVDIRAVVSQIRMTFESLTEKGNSVFIALNLIY